MHQMNWVQVMLKHLKRDVHNFKVGDMTSFSLIPFLEKNGVQRIKKSGKKTSLVAFHTTST